MFRKSALDATKTHPLGSVIALRPVSTSALVGLFALFGLCLLVFFCFGSYTKRVKVYGQLIPANGLVKVYAPQPGVVTAKHTTEGAFVTKGERLFTLSSERYSHAGAAIQETISQQLQRRLDLLERERDKLTTIHHEDASSLARTIANLSKTLDRIDGQISLQQKRVALAQDSTRRYQGLAAKNYVSRDQWQEKQALHLEQRTRLADLLQQHAETTKELGRHESEQRTLPLRQQAAVTQIERDILAITQDLTESEARRHVVILAPESGQVSSLLAEVGQYAEPNKTLLSLIPQHSELIADIYIKNKDIGFTRIGDRARVRYAPYPYQKFGMHGAHVASISTVAIPATEIVNISGAVPGLEQNSAHDLYYRASLRLDTQDILAYGTPQLLAPGMSLEVDILRETRAIYEWVLEPLYTITGKVSK
ncbi:HlyD family secretion protein [Bordetella tumulicola]|uniref:HlyD family secretion protein n=1 Tax=Bordetella tumulicola TaxID=1649133 RepID=UPI0039EE4E8F